ncbi:MAG: hypothetical protein J5J00_11400 [Deltaproteobacteria bacterium]|nr:hypothetical protein [Deltaproteobacteria bacterium]
MRSRTAKKLSIATPAPQKQSLTDLPKGGSSLPTPLKYKLYTEAVQAPGDSVEVIDSIFGFTFPHKAHALREDFCGTFRVGCSWIKSDPARSALGVDLGQEPLRFAKKNIASVLTPEERKRAAVYRQDVRVPTIPRVDVIAAENFSFYIFKRRAELVSYFRSAYSSLNKKGLLTLDMVGGRGFIDTPNDSRRTLKVKDTGLPSSAVYRWRQRRFNAVTNEAMYYIDFQINGHWYNEVFSYDWRVWSIAEVTEALKEAGFDDVVIYWDEERGKESVIKPVTRIASHWETWMCVVAGIKSAT